MGECASVEGFAILTVGAYQLGNTTKLLRLNLHTRLSGLYNIALVVNLPYALSAGIGRRRYHAIVFGRCDWTDGRRD